MVCYDIRDDRRRLRIARMLEGAGVRVQYSVFECSLAPDQVRELVGRLEVELDPSQDRVHVFNLCGKDLSDVRVQGQGQRPGHDRGFVLV